MAKTKEKSLAVVKNKSYDLANAGQMTQMAKVLKDYIVKNELSTKIVGKDYVNVEGWQFAGGLLGSFPRVKNVENISTGTEKKWKAEVEIVNQKTGAIISTGFAICSNAEGKKKSFDEYAILSMAQTRAIGKAYRNVIGWVIKLAGYEATPKEEKVNFSQQDITPTVSVDEVGIQEETGQIQKLMAERGLSATKQLQFIKELAEKKGYKFDGWRMSKKMSRSLLAALLAKKLQH